MQNKTSPSPARPVIWLIIALGIIAIIIALIYMFGNIGAVPFGFTAEAVLGMGLLFAIVGAILYFILPPVVEAPNVDTTQIDRSLNDVDAKTKLLEERLSTLEAQITSQTRTKPVTAVQDLTIIEGIGPKIRDALVAARIDTFEKLAGATDDRLKEAIKAGGVNFAPSLPTWSRQAGMVARGEMDAFEQYKEQLNAGRE